MANRIPSKKHAHHTHARARSKGKHKQLAGGPAQTKIGSASSKFELKAPGLQIVQCAANTAYYDGTAYPHKKQAIPQDKLTALQRQLTARWINAADSSQFSVPKIKIPFPKTIDEFFRPHFDDQFKSSDAEELYAAIVVLSGQAYVGGKYRSDSVTTILATKILFGQIDINQFMAAYSNFTSNTSGTARKELNAELEALKIPVALYSQKEHGFEGVCVLQPIK
ncbi:MAG: hypothetical protein COV45_01935 [Deltaproteobacteria bacterium CG11_big_fil_rev_8_21_14_0_20_47_16]|nr:MAG: hypothetical protein COV45_01935 [Deltaproteobacteria bacterium CG11_big_fil_rev_8_21_14_0_20_47_16]